ncbi:MAG: NUDIX domain-containing protein [Gammaproteobacteria bacterium]|nr:NUDIX domain-containing protein [Gammaproteobacteria bacterium]MCP5202124.1 NUDIX domain-containing protein [Gammaproteobacteria bacterium]
MSTLDLAVVGCTAQPLHAGHLAVIERARAAAAQVVVVLHGGDCARSLKTPWSEAERRAMLREALGDDPAVVVVAVRDCPYDLPRWRGELAAAVAAAAPGVTRIGLACDAALAGLWPSAWSRLLRDAGFAATEAALRDELLWAPHPDWPRVAARLGATALARLQAWRGSDAAACLLEEASFIRAFRNNWAAAPYPPVFVTVDGIVTHGDHVLLIQRDRAPGRDLWALPGGFLDQHETLEAAVRREVREETGLELAPGSAVANRVFDEPARSLRGRTITHAYHFVLDAAAARPAVAGADDARAAAWWALAELEPALLFEDHYAILQVLPGLGRP